MTAHSPKQGITPRGRWVLPVSMLLFGLLLGDVFRLRESVSADVRKQTQRTAFLSGSERSEVILTQISKTLLRMEKRMEMIETAIKAKPLGTGQNND